MIGILTELIGKWFDAREALIEARQARLDAEQWDDENTNTPKAEAGPVPDTVKRNRFMGLDL